MAAEADGVPSLRTGFAWSFAGNLVNGFSQWAILALIARLAGVQVLGEYALAVAVASPVAMLAHMNLRTLLATDVEDEHPVADYLIVRRWIALLGLVATTVVGLAWRPFWPVGVSIVIVGAMFSVENFEDFYYGVMQRRERLDLIAKSMVIRGVLAIACVAAIVRPLESAVAAAAGVLLSRLGTFLFFDVAQANARPDGSADPAGVLRKALPLGITLMLVALTAAIPRYVVEHRLGAASLGSFVAVISFITVGSVVMNALGQSATTRLARAFRAGDTRQFRILTLRLTGLALSIGLIGAGVAWLAGGYFLSIIYRPELARYQPLLVQALLAGTLGYVAAILGFVVSSARRFQEQLILLIAVTLSSAAIAWIAVPYLGLSGAVLAIAGAGAVQIAGNLVILRHAGHARNAG